MGWSRDLHIRHNSRRCVGPSLVEWYSSHDLGVDRDDSRAANARND